MAGKIDVLILDKNQDSAMELYESLRGFLDLGEVDYTNAIPKGLSFCLEHHYTLCLVVASLFDRAHLRSFIKDVKKISKEWDFPCAFVLVQGEENKRFDAESCKSMGFDTDITRVPSGKNLSTSDRKELTKILEVVLHEQEVQTRILEIDSTMETILKNLDQVAMEIKRGRKDAKLNRSLMTYLKDQATFDQRVLESYFRTLMRQTGASTPNEPFKLEIPQALLNKNFPGLTAAGYVGPSCRVWDRLVKRYGVVEE